MDCFQIVTVRSATVDRLVSNFFARNKASYDERHKGPPIFTI